MSNDFIGIANARRVADAINASRLTPETTSRIASALADWLEEIRWEMKAGRIVPQHHQRTGGKSRQLRGVSLAGIVEEPREGGRTNHTEPLSRVLIDQ